MSGRDPPQGLGQRPGTLRPIRRLLGQAAEQERLELGRDRLPAAGRRRFRFGAHVLEQDLGDAATLKERPARQQEVADGPDRVEVAPRIRLVGEPDRFGRHVMRRADDRVGGRQALPHVRHRRP